MSDTLTSNDMNDTLGRYYNEEDSDSREVAYKREPDHDICHTKLTPGEAMQAVTSRSAVESLIMWLLS